MFIRAILAFALSLSFTINALAASDFQFSITASGFSGWQLTSLSDPSLFFGPLATLNPTINLIVGKRYQVTNPDHAFHPFQIIASGGDPFSDVVLLAQDSPAGTFNADAGVGWTDNGAGTVTFTLTTPLLSAMRATGHQPGYRCAVHSSIMRGALAIFGDGTPIANPIAARIAKGTIRVTLTTVTAGLIAPLGADFARDGTSRMFVYDQAGKVWIVTGNTRLSTPFLDVSARLTPLGIAGPGSYDERGLLGFALHPNFANNGKVYTHTSEPVSGAADFTVPLPVGRTHDHQEVIAEWRVKAGSPNQIDPASRRELLRVDKPQFNHNGGAICFGPDGFLYVGFGDGGGADDSDGETFFGAPTVGHGTTGNGQNINTALGKILRIDVNTTNSANHRYGIPADNPFVGKPGLAEIYFYGLRNPYAFGFDQTGGALYIGDVGQNNIEEIDRLTSVQKGGNLGWRLKEGTFAFDSHGSAAGSVVSVPVAPLPPSLIDPIAQYDHDDGAAIVGGFVYRGTAIPALAGKYVCGDFGGFGPPAGRLYYLDTGNVLKEFLLGAPDRAPGIFLKGFAQDPTGEIFIMGSLNLAPAGTTGVVLKLAPWRNAVRSAWLMYD